jgi:hypothetical protein
LEKVRTYLARKTTKFVHNKEWMSYEEMYIWYIDDV